MCVISAYHRLEKFSLSNPNLISTFSQLIIGASIKRKSLETEKTLNDLLEDEIVELNEDNEDNAQDDPFYAEPREPRNKFLIYEEK